MTRSKLWVPSTQGAVTPSSLPSLLFNRLPMVRFVELQLLKSFYSYRFCSRDSIMKTENVRVSLAASWQPSPLLVKGWRRPLHAEQRISKPSLPEGREHTTEPVCHGLPKKLRSRAAREYLVTISWPPQKLIAESCSVSE